MVQSDAFGYIQRFSETIREHFQSVQANLGKTSQHVREPISTDPLESGVLELMFPLPYPCAGKLLQFMSPLGFDDMCWLSHSIGNTTGTCHHLD